jgi:hypothetical protein
MLPVKIGSFAGSSPVITHVDLKDGGMEARGSRSPQRHADGYSAWSGKCVDESGTANPVSR